MNKLQNIKIKLIALHLLVLRDRYPISPREQTNPYIGNIAHQCVANFSNLAQALVSLKVHYDVKFMDLLTKVNNSLLKKMKYPFSYLFFDTKITILLYNLNTLIKKVRFYKKVDGREETARISEESTAGLFITPFQVTPLLVSSKRYTFICTSNRIHISKRFMLTTIRNNYNKIFNGLNKNLRSYATYNVNKPGGLPSDPQSLHNNPVIKTKKGTIQHKEVHRQRCDQPGCNGVVCIGLCGEFKDRKAIGHATHGKSPAHEKDKVTVPVSETDLQGNPKPQNIVFYENAHDVNPTQEDITATQKINSDQNIINKIKEHEDKK